MRLHERNAPPQMKMFVVAALADQRRQPLFRGYSEDVDYRRADKSQPLTLVSHPLKRLLRTVYFSEE